jgi:hypothetical protein
MLRRLVAMLQHEARLGPYKTNVDVCAAAG